LLNDVARQGLNELSGKFDDFQRELDKKPETLEELTVILNVISTIRFSNEEVEMKYNDVLECYRTLKMYNVKMDEGESDASKKLPERWVELIEYSKQVDDQITAMKTKFTQTTMNQVKEFKIETKAFRVEYLERGPGSSGLDMDQGLEELQKSKELLRLLNERREKLVRAEKLFNLAITSYPELFEVEQNVAALESIYELYSDVKTAFAGWASTLWTNLDVSILNKGCDVFLARMKKMPKELKQLAPYNVVSEKIVHFKDAIPLYAELKNEALRERHWRKLMDMTGKSFDISPESFTLEKLFSMNLHSFSEQTSEIVNGAMKELSIENGVKEIDTVWRAMRFTVVKYMKGTEERGYILGAIDEIQTALDDNALNLQSMNASKFVTAFLPIVQKWEKTLSHIGEVLEVWLVVQRKWMYLESIFIGAGDIRMQLPEEVCRFVYLLILLGCAL
jgi:dynein heavy chain